MGHRHFPEQVRPFTGTTHSKRDGLDGLSASRSATAQVRPCAVSHTIATEHSEVIGKPADPDTPRPCVPDSCAPSNQYLVYGTGLVLISILEIRGD